MNELGAHRSLLNPLWYAGAFGIGLLAGRLGDRVSLGFVVETEKQVRACQALNTAFAHRWTVARNLRCSLAPTGIVCTSSSTWGSVT